MKHHTRIILLTASASLLAGCSLPAYEHIDIHVPDDVTTYVNNKEKQVGFIKPNNEKKIFWHTAKHEKSKYSIIYIHGFASSRLVHEPALSDLANKLQANYFATRIAGHGQNSNDMLNATATNWLHDTQEAIEVGKKIGDKVIIVCHSTGCPAVVKQLSGQDQTDIHAAIFVAPNFGPRNTLSEALLWPGGLDLAKQIHGTHSYVGKDKLTKKELALKLQFQKKIDACVTEVYPLESAHQVMLLVDQARKINTANITIPILIIYSSYDLSVSDTLIDTYTSRYTYATISKIHTQPDKIDVSNHIIIGQFTSPTRNQVIIKKIQDFIKTPQKSFEMYLD